MNDCILRVYNDFVVSFLSAGAVIATWKEKGVFTFWKVLKTLSLQNNNTVCFKSCYVIHKVLRDGYHEVTYCMYRKSSLLWLLNILLLI